MKSLNQIIDELRAFANAHHQIHTFGNGDPWEVSPSSDGITYPLLWFVPRGASAGLKETVTRFTVLCMDLVDSGEENETDVLSDTLRIVYDVATYYRQQHTQEYIIEFTSDIVPFTESMPERVSGHSIEIAIRQPFDYNECAIPMSNVPAPIVPTCAAAIIQNASTSPTFQVSVSSGDNYVLPQVKVLDSDGVTPILANYIPNTSGFVAECSAPSCADATVQLNGTTVGTVASGATDSFDVTQDGSPVGSWNGSAWIIPSCPSAGSLSVAVSNATPDYNGTVTITATPSGISPTSYTFLIACQSDGDAYVTQASNVLVWTVNRVGAIKVSVTATDGVDTVGATADLTVTDPLNYAAKLVDYDMRNNITLVGFEIDIVGDSSGNGHDVTATTSANRAYYDVYSDRFDTGSSPKDLRNLASNPLSGAGSFTMFAKFQKQASNATNQRLITFGASGAGFLVGLTSALGGDIVVGSNNFAQYTSASIVPQAGTPIAIVKNGTNPYEIYVDGVLATPVATGGTVPATLPVANGIYLGTQNGSFGFTGAFQRLAILTGALTATQIAAVNERIKVLHP